MSADTLIYEGAIVYLSLFFCLKFTDITPLRKTKVESRQHPTSKPDIPGKEPENRASYSSNWSPPEPKSSNSALGSSRLVNNRIPAELWPWHPRRSSLAVIWTPCPSRMFSRGACAGHPRSLQEGRALSALRRPALVTTRVHSIDCSYWLQIRVHRYHRRHSWRHALSTAWEVMRCLTHKT